MGLKEYTIYDILGHEACAKAIRDTELTAKLTGKRMFKLSPISEGLHNTSIDAEGIRPGEIKS